MDGQIGLERTPQAFLDALYAVFDEVKRVLRDDGVVFVNLGDSYAGSGKGPTGSNGIGDQEQRQGFTGGRGKTSQVWRGDPAGRDSQKRVGGVDGIRQKSLLLIPERFAIGMADCGWIVRSQIVWAKKSAMPESVRDRPTSAWEPIFMFTKQPRYFWDQAAVAEPQAEATAARRDRADLRAKDGRADAFFGDPPRGLHVTQATGTANLRNVWHLGPEPSRDEHYAAYPTEIPRRCIRAATSEKGQCPACGAPWRRVVERGNSGHHCRPGCGHQSLDFRDGWDGGKYGGFSNTARVTGSWESGCTCDAGDPVPQVVLDPFLGSGTTLVVADRLGRSGVGVELNPAYAEMARRRIEGDAPLFASVEVAS